MIAAVASLYLFSEEILKIDFAARNKLHKRAICQKLLSVAHPKDCKKWDWLHKAIFIVFSGCQLRFESVPTPQLIHVPHLLMPVKPVELMIHQTVNLSFYLINVSEFFLY